MLISVDERHEVPPDLNGNKTEHLKLLAVLSTYMQVMRSQRSNLKGVIDTLNNMSQHSTLNVLENR